jgi:predicted CopG family antitoxin
LKTTFPRSDASSIPDYADLSEFLDATHENEELSDEVEELVKYCKEIGQGMATAAMGQLSEECEQEVENEVEEEEEAEIEIAKQDPFAQEDWSFHQAFFNPELLFQNLFLRLKEFTKREAFLSIGH